ncbi:MAG TPA: hypothetical protein VMT61_05050 [Candidatus Binataceae bacterium]|nr:hypothetical protein [Candidatus Binataceae bacterium]
MPTTFAATGKAGSAIWKHPSSASGNTSPGVALPPSNLPPIGAGPAIGAGGGLFNCNPCTGPIAK